jgi:hypothetical protein
VDKGTNSEAAVYYRFRDASGRLHIVDSIDSVPQAFRSHALRVELDPKTAVSTVPSISSGFFSGPLASWQVFGLGFVAALIAAYAFRRMSGTLRFLPRLLFVGALIALAAGAYFGWLRRTTAQSSEAFAGPGALLDDAKQAVAKMNAHIQEEQTQLKEIEQTK